MLSELVVIRRNSLRSAGERFYAPEILSQAEREYRSAVSAAEEGEAEVADHHAGRARGLYREAALQFLEQGVADHLEHDLSEAPLDTSDDRYRRITSELDEVRKALVDARRPDVPVAPLRRQLAGLRTRMASLAGAPGSGRPGEVFDPGEILDPGDIWAPGTFGPPQAPLTIRVTERSANSLTIAWLNRIGAEANYLLRQRAGGPWVTVAEFGPLTGWTMHEDTGLSPDTRYSYRVRSEGPYGSSTSPLDNRACGHTRGVSPLRVWRLQLRIRVADISDAGSNDAVQVRLNSPLATYNPNGHSTWMDYGSRFEGSPFVVSDDFDRGRDFTYDVRLESQSHGRIDELTDITMLTIRKEGTDALGIAEIELRVNGVTVFERSFGETASTCLWIDEGDGHTPIYTVDYPELRAHDAWQAFVSSPPTPVLQISNAEMVSRIEGIVGDQLHGTPAYWGHRYGEEWVEASRVDDQTLHVDLDLSADVPGLDPEIDLDLDLHLAITCNQQAGTATMSVTSENLDASVDFDLLEEILTVGLVNLAEDDIANGIEKAFQPITQSITAQTGGLCPSVRVDASGNINFELTGDG
jgi:hypothetical protein